MTTALPLCDYNYKKLTPLNPKFNNISTTLCIDTCEEPVKRGPPLNRFESKDSKIKSMEFSNYSFYDSETGNFADLTEEDLLDVAYADKTITIESKRYISDFSNPGPWNGDFSNVEIADSTKMEFTAKSILAHLVFVFSSCLNNAKRRSTCAPGHEADGGGSGAGCTVENPARDRGRRAARGGRRLRLQARAAAAV